MSGLFVNKEDTLQVTVFWENQEDVTKIVDNPSEEKKKSVESLTIKFRKPDFESAQIILHSSTIFAESGEPVIDFMRIRKSLIYHLSTEWDAKDDNGKSVPLLPENISAMNPTVAAAACSLIEKKIGSPVGLFMA